MNRILVLVNRPIEYLQEFKSHSFVGSECYFVDGRSLVKSGDLDLKAVIKDGGEHVGEGDLNLPSLESFDVCLGSPEYIMPLISEFSSSLWIQSTHAGVDGFLLKDKLKGKLEDIQISKDMTLTGVKGIFGGLMSEYVIGQLIGFERGSIAQWENQKIKKWKRWVPGTISNKTMMILGTGSIGQGIARSVKTFGINTMGVNTSGASASEFNFTIALNSLLNLENKQLNEELSHESSVDPHSVDYIVNTLPLTSLTTNLIDKRFLRLFSDKAVLVNVGRGETVDEIDLVALLKEKNLRGAILDVFSKEPLGEESHLWGCPNLVISPHNGAITAPADIVHLFKQNYDLYVANKPLKYKIDLSKGY